MNRILVIIIIPIKGHGFGGQGPLGQVLGTAKQRGSLCPDFVPPFTEHSLGCRSLAGISKGFSSDLPWGHTDASGISILHCYLL